MTRVAALRLEVDGEPLPPTVMRDVLSVSVNDDLRMTSTFSIKINAWDAETSSISWADRPLFALGRTVEILPGYESATLQSVMYGTITDLELDYPAPGSPVLTVTGHDVRHKLAANSTSDSYAGLDSDIARQIITRNQARPDVTATRVRFVHTSQRSETDLAFLLRLAARNGYDLTANRDAVRFAPPSAFGPPVPLLMNRDLSSFSAATAASTLINEVRMSGVDAITGAPFEAVAPLAKVSGILPQYDRVTMSSYTSSEAVAANQTEASALTKAKMNELAEDYLTGAGQCYFGDSSLRAGVTVDIDGVGRRFGGRYRLWSVTHAFSAQAGYTTNFRTKAVSP